MRGGGERGVIRKGERGTLVVGAGGDESKGVLLERRGEGGRGW